MPVAVIDIAGKQFTARVGTSFWIDKMALDVGAVVACRRIVLLMDEKGCLIGEPFEKEAVAYLRVQEHARGKKVLIFKKKRRHGYRRLKGFRADQTRVECVALEMKTEKGLDAVCAVGAQSGALDKALLPVIAPPAKKQAAGAPKKVASAPKPAAQKKPAEKPAKTVSQPAAAKKSTPAEKPPVKKAAVAKKMTPKKE